MPETWLLSTADLLCFMISPCWCQDDSKRLPSILTVSSPWHLCYSWALERNKQPLPWGTFWQSRNTPLCQPLSGKDMDRTKQAFMLHFLKGQRVWQAGPLPLVTSLFSDLGATAVQALELVRITNATERAAPWNGCVCMHSPSPLGLKTTCINEYMAGKAA